ncbi:hypothetical protein EDEG_03907 [Edhazardia aedis USNM 41457]|uniref:Uncharacterized protein n=1 Tax=Edhazardia aedis (strain USNM 41457) TaxID=1003232 RepID=J9D1Q9_EDHAE|nr:hypothetical protein EDEG_03907 [Edhazardia aedis USNM 41457]|eukprot:EJW01514.1 hypothetical protein EDEG_03907 [Edhazardia aedis USNM 41457]
MLLLFHLTTLISSSSNVLQTEKHHVDRQKFTSFQKIFTKLRSEICESNENIDIKCKKILTEFLESIKDYLPPILLNDLSQRFEKIIYAYCSIEECFIYYLIENQYCGKSILYCYLSFLKDIRLQYLHEFRNLCYIDSNYKINLDTSSRIKKMFNINYHFITSLQSLFQSDNSYVKYKFDTVSNICTVHDILTLYLKSEFFDNKVVAMVLQFNSNLISAHIKFLELLDYKTRTVLFDQVQST